MDDNQALIVIDMQKGIFKKKVFNEQVLVDNVNKLLAFFHEANKPVFLLRHTNGSFLQENSEDWQISDEVNIRDDDIIINKTYSSVFKEKLFMSLLKEKKITSVVIAGLISNGCIKAAGLDGIKLGFPVVLISDGHSTYHKDAENQIDYWNTFLQSEGVKLATTDDFINK